MSKKNLLKTKEKGSLLIMAVVFGSIAVVIIGALVSWAAVNIKAGRLALYREQALQISEAGIDYYRWHLAHASVDYKDGTNLPGPYVHVFYNKDGVAIGSFTLTITPPLVGSTLVSIESDGRVNIDSTVIRKIKVQLGIPSLAKYAAVSNSTIYFAAGDQVFGPIHSNAGIGFWDGTPEPIAHNTVTSAVSTMTDTALNSPCPGTHFGVYTCVAPADPTPPATVPSRPDVFAGGRTFPVPVVDFNSITSDLSSIKAAAISAGFYRAASGGVGYKVVLKTNDTFDLYKVNSLLPAPSGCTAPANNAQPGWGTWSIGTVGGATTLIGNFAFPANGLLFFEDHVWVEGQINTARLTIGAGVFPVNSSTYKHIIVNNNLTYSNFNGTDAIGLIAQGNFIIGMASADNLIIDAAIIAQNGGTFRYLYTGPKCSPWHVRTSLTTYGMFASNGQAYFSYGLLSGYQNQPASYDSNFLYGPPPSFPLTGNQYQILSWKEIQ